MITCKNDRLLELLWFVGYCIEFPAQLAVRIGGGAEWNRRVMYRAIREGYVKLFRKKHHRHVIRSLSLTEKGFDYVAQHDPEAWAMIHSRISNSDPVYHAWIEKILRLHAIAIGTVMANAGGSFLPRLRTALRRRYFADSPVDIGGGCALHIVCDVGVDVQRGRRRHMAQHGGESFHIHTVLQSQRREGVPLRYNYDKPEKPRRIKGFEVFSLVFSSFSKPKNHTEIS